MPLVTLANALAIAKEKNIAIGAFNIGNYESLKAVIDCASEEKLPVIVQIFNRLFNDDKARDMAALVKVMAENVNIPVVLHLDHGKTIAQVERAVQYGFTSVMIDASDLPMEENIQMTKAVVAIAHSHHISVEAELGRLLPKGAIDCENFLTVPEEALEFVKQTGIDALAVAIGTSHGFYKETPFIDLERLKKINAMVGIPIVLHGGSGTPDDIIQKSVLCGIRKINLATELHQAYIDGIAIQAEIHKEKFSPIDVYNVPVYEKMKKLVRQKMRLFALMSPE
ncbi:MAG: class II fructose-bisphosphate aldolase [Prolixibacteraceae bacterium]|jgi:fructose-bisphosphate aldolase class II|nr:class II fructose-bisphosphate aldolase [Prolixibacteraceae bacterium]